MSKLDEAVSRFGAALKGNSLNRKEPISIDGLANGR
jgi:hypothetical protein